MMALPAWGVAALGHPPTSENGAKITIPAKQEGCVRRRGRGVDTVKSRLKQKAAGNHRYKLALEEAEVITKRSTGGVSVRRHTHRFACSSRPRPARPVWFSGELRPQRVP